MRRTATAIATILLLALATPAFGQSGVAVSLRSGANDPGSCTESGLNVFLNRTTNLVKYCDAGSWVSLSTAVAPTFTGQLHLSDGTATEPSWVWTSDDDATGTGMFRGCANCLSFTTNGVERWIINASGALNPLVANTYDIGGATTIRDIGIGRDAIFSGSTSGTITLKADAVAGTNTITLPAVTGKLGAYYATMVSAAGIGNTAATTDDPLWTLTSLPVNTLTAAGDAIVFSLELRTAANGNNKRIGITVGGTQVNTNNTSANAANFGGRITVRYVDSTHVNVQIICSGGAGCHGGSYNLAVADMTANTLALVITGASPTTGAAGDVLLMGGSSLIVKN